MSSTRTSSISSPVLTKRSYFLFRSLLLSLSTIMTLPLLMIYFVVFTHRDQSELHHRIDLIDPADCRYSPLLHHTLSVCFIIHYAVKVFQQTVGIPMGTNCAPLLADFFLYSYEADFIQSLLSTGKKHLASRFNLTYRYIDDVLSINNPEFENYLGQMYPAELEIKDTTESTTSASYLDSLLSIGRNGQLYTSIYDKRDDFNNHLTNFPFLSSNIPSSPAYGVFISQLLRFPRGDAGGLSREYVLRIPSVS